MIATLPCTCLENSALTIQKGRDRKDGENDSTDKMLMLPTIKDATVRLRVSNALRTWARLS